MIRARSHDAIGCAPCRIGEGHDASSRDMVLGSPSSQRVAEASREHPSRPQPRPATLTDRKPFVEAGKLPGTSEAALPMNFYTIVACVLVCILIIFIGILVPMLVIRSSANARNAELREKEYITGTAWTSVLRTVMIDGLAAARALEGYAMSTFPVLQSSGNVSAVPPRENTTEYVRGFQRFASLLASQKPAVALQAICPGGVITTTYPHDPESVGRNLLSPDDPTNRYTPTTIETVQSGRYAIVGPRRTTIVSLRRLWVIFTRVPLYINTSSGAPPSLANFWGFVLLIVNVTGALDVIQLDTLAQATHLNYALYDTSSKSADMHVIASSLPSDTTEAEYKNFIADSTAMDILAPLSTLHIAVRSRETYVSLTPTNITIIILWTMFGSLLLLGIAIAVIMWSTRAYDAAAHAPKMAPFAMLTIGPCRGEELWDLASDQMVDVTERLAHVLARQMVRYRAYQIQQVHPLTTSYVTRSVAAAVQMAFSTIEELQRHPIDGPLRAVLGNRGPLRLAYAVHWCTDAAVRVESLEGTYRYEGPDVVFGGRMWAFAAPSVVTASEAVAQALPRFGLRSVDARPYRVVNVILSTPAKRTDNSDHADIADAAVSSSRSGSRILYLLVNAAKAHLVVAAEEVTTVAAAAGATVAQLVLDNTQAADTPSGRIACVGSSGAGAEAAVSSLQGVSLRSIKDASPAFTTWDAACSEKRCSRVANAPQRRGCSSPHGHPGGRSPLSDGTLHAEQQVVVSSQLIVERATASSPKRPCLVLIEADSVTRALLQPLIPRALDVALRVAFDYQSITLNVRYDEVRVLVYYFYSSYKILFRPLAAPERLNIFRRLVTAFGVPQQGILEHLAARAAVQWLSQVRKINRFVYRRGSLEGSSSRSTTASSSMCNSSLEAQQPQA
ncbi:hypothetical protein LSCM4_06720 [Leishmania orientalis]|uniref:CHASE domain-containing protein n=1 Tax=Leishmania orientalis TaxID=2249476 RepID=A0A836H528_9TRYP|nr:hypothetical protein LSCM4_06720 [Leishmania orientalis]